MRHRRTRATLGAVLGGGVFMLLSSLGCTSAPVDCSDHLDCTGDRCCVNGRCRDLEATCFTGDAEPEPEVDAEIEIVCPVDPVFSGACPAVCTGGCVDGWCAIVCAEEAACQAAVIECPTELPCRIACDGSAACQQSELRCAAAASCELHCRGVAACQGSTLRCGAAPCSAWCAGDEAGPASLDCGPACRCEGCDGD